MNAKQWSTQHIEIKGFNTYIYVPIKSCLEKER